MPEKNTEVDGFYRRFQAIQTQRVASDELIKDLILHAEKNEKLLLQDKDRVSKEAEGAKLDLADSIASRQDLQKLVDFYRAELLKFTSEYDIPSKARNPYITILIDGDGLIFQERYVGRGFEGGKAAAFELRRLVLQQCGQLAATMDVQAKIFANLRCLSKPLVRDSIIWKEQDLREFFMGFTQADGSFDFVDVGDGKDRAACKIRENTRWHLQNNNCKQILLGVSHDPGYASFLDEILGDEMTRRQVTVLEGVPTVRELVATGINIFSEDRALFRTEKIKILPTDERSTTFGRAMSIELSAPSSMTGSPQATSTTTVPTPPPLSNNSPSTSWAGMAQKVKPASPPPVVTLPLANRTNVKSRSSSKAKTTPTESQPASLLDDWNPGERGLDDHIAPVQATLDEIKKRRDNQKICNNHFLRGPCTKQGCAFVHDYNPTDDELTVIAYLARLNPCTRGQDCDNYECIYGHHCQSMKGDMCVHPYCKFPGDAHPPGTKYKNSHIDKNN